MGCCRCGFNGLRVYACLLKSETVVCVVIYCRVLSGVCVVGVVVFVCGLSKRVRVFVCGCVV